MAAILKLRRGTSVPTLLESELFYHQTLDTVIVGDGTDSHILLKSGSNSVNYVSLSGDLTASNIRVQNDIRIGGNIYLGDSLANDNINIQASLSGSLIPSASNEYDLGSTTRYWRNTYLTSASILDITLPGSNIVSGSSQLTSSYDLRYLNTDGDSVFSQSVQVDHDQTTNFVANEHINHTSVTISGGSGLTGGGHIGQSRTISLNTGSAHFNDGVKDKLNTETVISSSIQVDHDATTNFVADEHIAHSGVTITAGNGLTGGGDITTTRTLNVVSANNGIVANADNIQLDVASSTFTDGVKSKLNSETVVSGSSQIDHDSTTNFVANEHIDHSGVTITAGNGLTGGGDITTNRTINVVSANNGIVANADNIQLDVASSTFTDGVKSKLNSETVVSGSSQIDVTTTTNYSTISSHISSTSNPHGVDATDVGLGNVTNESKATMFASPTFTGTVAGVTATHVGLGNVDNTSDANKPVSTAQQTALNSKLNIEGSNVVSSSAQVVTSLLNQSVDFGTGDISGSVVKLNAAGADGLILDEDTSNSTLSSRLFFMNNQTSGWAIHKAGNHLEFKSGSIPNSSSGVTKLKIYSGTDNVEVTNGNLVIGTAGKGIDFSATSDGSGTTTSELLDDYEEGTWTVGISFDGNSVGVTTSRNTGTYVKVGRQVTVNGDLILTSKGSSSGIARITGLPFTNGAGVQNLSPIILRLAKVTFANQLQGYVEVATTTISLEEITEAGTVTSLSNSDFANDSQLMVTATYFV